MVEIADRPTTKKEQNIIECKHLNTNTTLPTRGTEDSAGLDLYTLVQLILPYHRPLQQWWQHIKEYNSKKEHKVKYKAVAAKHSRIYSQWEG